MHCVAVVGPRLRSIVRLGVVGRARAEAGRRPAGRAIASAAAGGAPDPIAAALWARGAHSAGRPVSDVPALSRRTYAAMAAEAAPIQASITAKLTEAFAPTVLEVENESYKHSVPKGSESHFKVRCGAVRCCAHAHLRPRGHSCRSPPDPAPAPCHALRWSSCPTSSMASPCWSGTEW